MLYLLDANVLIDANRDYYPISRVPEFWDWLEHQGRAGQVAIPIEVYEKVKDATDDLAAWIKRDAVREAVLLDDEVDPEVTARVVEEGYAPDLTDDEIEGLNEDPFLVARAMEDTDNRCVVTTERSKPTKQRANRHLPDVCRHFGVECQDTFAFIRGLDFTTDWQQRGNG